MARGGECGGLVPRRRTAAPADRYDAGDTSTPAPHLPALSRGERRVSQVPRPSSSCVPWSTTPPGAANPRPFSVWSPSPSGFPTPWAPGKVSSFEAAWPTAHTFACLRFAEFRYRPRRKARYRPGGFRTRWMTYKVSWGHRIPQSPSTSLAWSHWKFRLDLLGGWDESRPQLDRCSEKVRPKLSISGD